MIGTCGQKPRNRSLRSFILQQVMNQKDIEEAYENFCEENGTNAMEYPEFDFWYYRFYNEEHLDYDRNLETKKRTFSDLPIEVVGKLVDKLDSVDRLSLRKVSHRLQDVVNKEVIACKDLSFAVYDNYATLHLDDRQIDFKLVEGGCQVKYRIGKDIIEGGNHLKMAINEFLYIMKHPNLQLEQLVLGFYVSNKNEEEKHILKQCLELIESELKTLKNQIHIENVIFTSDRLEPLFSIIPYSKPGTLQSITLQSNSSKENQLALDKLFELNQWKQAVKTDGYLNRTDFAMSIERVFYFTNFLDPWTTNMQSRSREDFMEIRDVLLKASNFRSYILICEELFDKKDVENIFNVVYEEWLSFQHRDPGTGKAFQFDVKPYCVKIQSL